MRRRRPRRLFWFILFVMGASLCAAGVAAWVTRFNVGAQRARASETNTASAPSSVEPRAALRPEQLAKLSRQQLEAEVVRLDAAVADRDRSLDELKIQLKLANEGSRSPR